ncbi:MAG: 3-phosphoserine/phosphohydroxythreonine transaminase [Lautropia sp.]|nr:3-phosphoserine/phosphohydroxythreonine transaminase [Lautropia sp.]
MRKLFNFSAGPAVLPKPVLEQAAAEMSDWHGTGMSVMEMSHRGKDYMSIQDLAEADLRELLGIPDDYRVLFLGGGAILQFAALALNLLPEGQSADYIDTGIWSDKAYKEAQRFGHVRLAASARDSHYTAIPSREHWQLDPKAAYVHLCGNETIGGLEFQDMPDVGNVPLVVDASSHILSRPLDVRHCGMIYGGAQKNIGPAGMSFIIIRDDLLGRAQSRVPSVLDYTKQAENGSMLNTPPTYAIYIAGLVFQWLKAQGGLTEMARRNKAKAQLLYDTLDASDFYHNAVNKADRSWMNIPFTLADDALDAAFLQGACERGLMNLKGHRSVGGMRASLYNAMPIEGVQALVAYMQDFEKTRA